MYQNIRPIKILHLCGGSLREGVGTYLWQLICRNPKGVIIYIVGINIEQDINYWRERLQLNTDTVKAFNISACSSWDIQLPHLVFQSIKNLQPDIIHTHGYKADCIGFWLKAKLECPLVTTAHGWTESTLRDRVYKRLDLFALCRFDRVIGISNYICNLVVSSGVKKGNVIRVYHGIEIPERIPEYREESINSWRNELAIKQNQLVIGTVGRLSPEKGHRFLLWAFALLRGKNIDAHLLIVGDGIERSFLEKEAKRLGISSNVSFVGYQRHPKEFIKIMDIFVLPSLREGLSFAILEAFSAKVPVVASCIGGIPEIISDQTGLLTRPGDPKDLLAKIEILAKNSALREILGQNGYKIVKEIFSVERMVSETFEVYEDAIAKKGFS